MPSPIVIDLSHWNTVPSSFMSAKQAGIIGVIHKATEGSSYKDEKCDSREFLARDAGIMFGLYHFLRAGVSINNQVSNFVSVYRRYGRSDILVALDYEKGSDGKTPTITEVQQWLEKCEDTLGVKPVLYSGNAIKEAVKGGRHPVVNGDNFPLWLAHYTTGTPTLPKGWSNYWLWQYTDEGAVPGVQPPTDLNAGDAAAVTMFWVGSQPPPPTSLDFSDAMRRVLDGEKMRRAGWNGKGMWIALQPVSVGGSTHSTAYVCMRTAQGTLVPWLASVTDMVAYDWELAV